MAHNSFISFIDQATRPGGAFFADVTIENIRDELYNLSTNDYTDIASRTNSYMSSMTLLSFILNTLPETDEKMSLAATALATAALASSAGDPKEAKTVLNEMTSVPNIPEKIRSQGLVALSELVQSIVHPSKESSTTAPEPPKPQNMHR